MKSIVFYDGQCRVCNYWVGWILQKKKSSHFMFASLDSEFATEFFEYYNYSIPKDTMVVWSNDLRFLVKSDAVIYILNQISPSSISSGIIRLFPKPIRDVGYTIFAILRKLLPITKCEFSFEQKGSFLSNKKDFYSFLKSQ